MSVDTKFAAKTTTVAPLTRVADAFSAHTYATPDFRQGRVVVADFQYPDTFRLNDVRTSYTGSTMTQDTQ